MMLGGVLAKGQVSRADTMKAFMGNLGSRTRLGPCGFLAAFFRFPILLFRDGLYKFRGRKIRLCRSLKSG